MEFVLEFFLTFWMEIVMGIVPKGSAKNTRFIAKLIVIILIFYVIGAFTAGSIMLSEGVGSKMIAIIFIVTSVLIFLFQMVSGVIYYFKSK